jgi:hypothetical protein
MTRRVGRSARGGLSAVMLFTLAGAKTRAAGKRARATVLQMSPVGQKARLLQQAARPPLALFPISDQPCAALQYVAKGQKETHAPQQSGSYSITHCAGG